MTVRQIAAGIVAVVLLMVGVLALHWPVYLPDFDPWGVQIKCGSGFSADLVQASFAGEADHCQHALVVRRMWAIPVTVVGWPIVVALALPMLRPQDVGSSN
ncbi:hypothetical protein ORI20_14365 [Mycobacterium sp. CVI_P3]|uniref:Transmembrane protein n=1 Tax=Mycobacterium pinniadriaticum TaxID=2994102 RepID=A0ABT3SES4_9MYCO|nr:hypothetical protein [Mycobacterium pinniadriaticum]MCX2931463.1 hypothetical protein [Mycobacterium pinniadriaticum]MCX2937887.1 hypothetical protein [Mycobacterium pinniadriaticum]